METPIELMISGANERMALYPDYDDMTVSQRHGYDAYLNMRNLAESLLQKEKTALAKSWETGRNLGSREDSSDDFNSYLE